MSTPDAITRPIRKCQAPEAQCGKLATVICTGRDGLQWYACDDPKHRGDSLVMPLEEWWRIIDRQFTPLEGRPAEREIIEAVARVLLLAAAKLHAREATVGTVGDVIHVLEGQAKVLREAFPMAKP